MLVPTTVVYAVALVAIKLMLFWRIVSLRQRYNVGLGDGQHRDLQVAVRAHGNYMESMPLLLLLLFIAEMNGVAIIALHGVALLFIGSRGAHALGMLKGNGNYAFSRVLGVVGNWLSLLLLCLLLVHNLYGGGLL